MGEEVELDPAVYRWFASQDDVRAKALSFESSRSESRWQDLMAAIADETEVRGPAVEALRSALGRGAGTARVVFEDGVYKSLVMMGDHWHELAQSGTKEEAIKTARSSGCDSPEYIER